MNGDVLQAWLASGLPAVLDGQDMRPLANPILPDQPLCMDRGQAKNYVLTSDAGARFILKKFHRSSALERGYLEAVAQLLPHHPGCRCGTQRRILNARSLTSRQGCYYDASLAGWLEDTVLMPMLDGASWSTVADQLRTGQLSVTSAQRLSWCTQLCDLVAALEAAGCAHRDLSGGNTFLNVQVGSVALIDWDCLYHAQLTMPASTPCGTDGYVAPFVRQKGLLQPAATWCPGADRFPLALLNVEFLLLDAQAPETADGGMFDQDELFAWRGPGLDALRTRLRATYPPVAPLLEQALQSTGCGDCPGPAEWQHVLGVLAGAGAPRLSAMPRVNLPSLTQRVLVPSAPAPVPSLRDLPKPAFAPVSTGKTSPVPVPQISALPTLSTTGSQALPSPARRDRARRYAVLGQVVPVALALALALAGIPIWQGKQTHSTADSPKSPGAQNAPHGSSSACIVTPLRASQITHRAALPTLLRITGDVNNETARQTSVCRNGYYEPALRPGRQVDQRARARWPVSPDSCTLPDARTGALQANSRRAAGTPGALRANSNAPRFEFRAGGTTNPAWTKTTAIGWVVSEHSARIEKYYVETQSGQWKSTAYREVVMSSSTTRSCERANGAVEANR